MSLLQNDKEVKCILINIFGGILHCDKVAVSILEATEEVGLTKPIVVRLKGNEAEEGKRILKERGRNLGIRFMDELDEAADLAVKLAKEHSKKLLEASRN